MLENGRDTCGVLPRIHALCREHQTTGPEPRALPGKAGRRVHRLLDGALCCLDGPAPFLPHRRRPRLINQPVVADKIGGLPALSLPVTTGALFPGELTGEGLRWRHARLWPIGEGARVKEAGYCARLVRLGGADR